MVNNRDHLLNWFFSEHLKECFVFILLQSAYLASVQMYGTKIKDHEDSSLFRLSLSEAFIKRTSISTSPVHACMQKKLSFCTQIFTKMKSNGHNRLTPEVERAY